MAPPMDQMKRLTRPPVPTSRVMAPPTSRVMAPPTSRVMGPVPTSQEEKKFCIFDGHSIFVVIPVSPEGTLEELQKLSLHNDDYNYHLPDRKINPIGTSTNIFGSLVSVGSMVYCIGGFKRGDVEPNNKVIKFDADQPQLKIEPCCNMITARRCPAVVSIDGKIYVFGGISSVEERPWAEFLDTNKPQSEQKWKALKEPVSRLSRPIAIYYDAENIVIDGSHMDQGSIIYNVADESSLRYDSEWDDVMNPVTVSSDKTIYWIDDMFFRAYELDTHTSYQAYTSKVLPDFEKRFWNKVRGPVLVHLKDNLFNIFTLSFIGSFPNMSGIVDCTKIRVTKSINKSGEGVLRLDRVGFQSYQCDPMWALYSAVSIEARRG